MVKLTTADISDSAGAQASPSASAALERADAHPAETHGQGRLPSHRVIRIHDQKASKSSPSLGGGATSWMTMPARLRAIDVSQPSLMRHHRIADFQNELLGQVAAQPSTVTRGWLISLFAYHYYFR